MRFFSFSLALATATALCVLSSCGAEAGEVWTLPPNPSSWSRDKDAITTETINEAEPDGQPETRVVHTGSRDWSVFIPDRIAVKPGDVFTIRYSGKSSGDHAIRPSVALYDADGQAISWVYGGRAEFSNGEWVSSETKFVVPPKTAFLQGRVIGDGPVELCVKQFQLERTDSLPLPPVKGTLPAENSFLRVKFNLEKASFSVLDVRTKRRREQIVPVEAPLVLNAKPIARGVDFELLNAENFTRFHALVQLEESAPEIVVQLKGAPGDSLVGEIGYPYPFSSRSTDRVVLPMNEGISFPATENPPSIGWIHTYGGHGLCMAFWGVVNDVIDASQSDGFMGIVETPDDAAIRVQPMAVDSKDPKASDPKATALSIAQQWQNSKRTFGYDRSLRLVFFDRGGHVAMCKRYRRHAEKLGLLVSFDEKVKRNPNLADGIDLLVGAANIWNWDSAVDCVRELRELGFDRILWSGGASAQAVKELNKLDGVLTSEYDIYQDIMDPARYPELSYVDSKWLPEAWPKDIVWNSPDGDWTKGWSVNAKDPSKPRIPCGVLCDLKAVPYAEKRIAKLLETTPYRCRFIDTTVASPWRECWNPDHPMTRSQCKEARMKLLGLLGSRFNLVCGSETGIDASVPYCDFYEGMMSLGPYRCPESGRDMGRIWTDVPEVVEKYQLGEVYRLPLFELVYHGCLVSYWYWGDYNNKFPSLWRKRDLFNALYGTPPMYMFSKEFLEKNRDRFVESYQIAEPVSRLTGRVEMTDHLFLTEDRKVQKTVFANGVSVVVNFSDEDYRDEECGDVPPFSSKVLGANR